GGNRKATNHVMNGSCGAVDSCVHDAWPQPRYHQRSRCHPTPGGVAHCFSAISRIANGSSMIDGSVPCSEEAHRLSMLLQIADGLTDGD
ncbi:wax ester/triacylglycerol synthase family O-acyltransferase, partial [Roseiconus lacunae]|uniref:wax ester/triacylglycerol synthase family O-acyltransferase n=1 Tax=Roseiconus lacunae TaxID=2605694 RepID=UPI001E358DF1